MATDIIEGKILRLSLTGHEVYRLANGDHVDIKNDFAPTLDHIHINCAEPQSVELVGDLEREISQLSRDVAIARSRRPFEIPDGGRPLVCIPTVGGDSLCRVQRLIDWVVSEGFSVAVLDDGGGFESDKQHVANNSGAGYVRNGGSGIPSSLNNALSLPHESKWLILLDDGAIPHWKYLEDAVALLACADGDICDHRIGMIGWSHLQDWQLALGGRLNGRWKPLDWYTRPPGWISSMARYFFRVIPCPHPIEFGSLETLDVGDDVPEEIYHYRYVTATRLEPELVTRRCKYQLTDRWPHSNIGLRVNWSPGAQGLIINREFLEKCGGFTHDCVGYEQLLACKAAEMGWISLFFDGPPFVHFPSLGFNYVSEHQVEPRQHRDIYDVCESIWGEKEPGAVVRRFVSEEQEAAMNHELSLVGQQVGS